MISASVTIKSQFYDLDPMGIVWHGNYARFFEQARCALLDLIGYNYQQMTDSGYLWPIVEMRTKYIRPILFPQDIEVKASLAEYENRIKINYLITDSKSGERLTRGFTTQVAIDKKTNEMQFQSPEILYSKVEKLLCAED